jgi:hypothetical protein
MLVYLLLEILIDARHGFIPKNPTRNDPILHLILTNMSEFCSPVEVTAPVGQSDHNSVLCPLQTVVRNQYANISVRRRNYKFKAFFSKMTNESQLDRTLSYCIM